MLSWQARILKLYLRVQLRLARPLKNLDVQRERADTEAWGAKFKPLTSFTTTPLLANGVPAAWIVSAHQAGERVLLHLHGGSYIAGSLTSHQGLAANLAAATQARVLLVDYRLAPEYPFPAALMDAVQAYQWAVDCATTPDHLVITGDSAGAGLAVALLVYLRDNQIPLPAKAVCLSPWTDLACNGESWRTNARADILLNPSLLRQAAQLYLGGADPCNPLASPLYADLRGLPLLLIQAGSDELLLSDATRLAEKARTAEVPVTLEVWAGMQHEWQLAASVLPEARRAIARIADFISSA